MATRQTPSPGPSPSPAPTPRRDDRVERQAPARDRDIKHYEDIEPIYKVPVPPAPAPGSGPKK